MKGPNKKTKTTRRKNEAVCGREGGRTGVIGAGTLQGSRGSGHGRRLMAWVAVPPVAVGHSWSLGEGNDEEKARVFLLRGLTNLYEQRRILTKKKKRATRKATSQDVRP